MVPFWPIVKFVIVEWAFLDSRNRLGVCPDLSEFVGREPRCSLILCGDSIVAVNSSYVGMGPYIQNPLFTIKPSVLLSTSSARWCGRS